MQLFVQRLFDGMANGAVYGSLALALALIYRTSGLLNFGQGEMATFGTYLALILNTPATPALAGTGIAALLPLSPWPLWAAIVGAMVVSFVLGAALEPLLIRRLRGKSAFAVMSVTVGLFLIINALMEQWWFPVVREFPKVFPDGSDDYTLILGARLRHTHVGTWLTILVMLGLLWLLLTKTRAGLAFRAVSSNASSAELVGIHVNRTQMLGWGLAASVGTLAGAIVAPTVHLNPDMMVSVLVFSFAAATLGGLDSIGGSVLGGLIVGVGQTMLGGYVGFIGSELSLLGALAIMVVILVVRPTGLFGSRAIERV